MLKSMQIFNLFPKPFARHRFMLPGSTIKASTRAPRQSRSGRSHTDPCIQQQQPTVLTGTEADTSYVQGIACLLAPQHPV